MIVVASEGKAAAPSADLGACAADATRRSAPLVLLVVLALSLAAVFPVQIETHFGFVTGDRLDGLIQVSIFEHWFNVLRGDESWDTTNYFTPHHGTLGYNDGYLLYGIVYAALRGAGLDPFLASEAVFGALRVLGFATAYGFGSRALGLRAGWAVLGACLFTISISTFQQSAHSQILSIALAPSAALLAWRLMRALAGGRRRAALGWGAALAVWMAAWLLTAFYMAWFVGLFGLVLLLSTLVVNTGWRDRAALVVRREWSVLLVIGVVFVVSAAPFLALYLPKARESGMHSFAAVRPYLPTVEDTIRLGPGDLLFGWADHLLRQVSSREHVVGWPPVELACFIAAALSWRRWPASRAAVASIAVIYLASLAIGRWTAWLAVWELLPGAKAIRVVSRAWIMLAGPMLCVVLLWLQRLSVGRPRLARGLAVLLVAEQLSTGSKVAALDRPRELAELDAMLPPPAGCHAFAVLTAGVDDPESDSFLQTTSANANAMLIAEVAHLPTINGTSTFDPPDWNFADPDDATYQDRVSTYAQAHGLKGLCGLDLRTGRWYRDFADYRRFHLVPTGGPLSLRSGESGAALLAAGWHRPVWWGRWAGRRGELRFWPQGGSGAVAMTVWAVADATPPDRPHQVAVIADGSQIATWSVSSVPVAYHVVLPHPRDRRAFEVSFVDRDAGTMRVAGQDEVVGLGVIAIELDRLGAKSPP